MRIIDTDMIPSLLDGWQATQATTPLNLVPDTSGTAITADRYVPLAPTAVRKWTKSTKAKVQTLILSTNPKIRATVKTESKKGVEKTMSNKIPNSKKYVKVSDVKKKIRYVAKQYGISNKVNEIINKHLDKIPFFLESEIETTLTSDGSADNETD